MKTFFKLLPSLILPILGIFLVILYYNPVDSGMTKVSKLKIRKYDKTVDHSKFAILQQKFEYPQDLTAACLSCHNKRGSEFMKTSHWNWASPDTLADGTVKQLGKKNVLNNFCVGINSNEGLCTKCHTGYGWTDKSFNHSEESNVDCIVCHDNTGNYKKTPGTGGYPSSKIDMVEIAKNVGPTKNENCLSCHGKGGGGNNVKHGDLEMAQANPDVCTKDVDIHMAKDGANLNCSQCHISVHHNIKGEGPMTNANHYMDSENRASCIQCHTTKPHNNTTLNEHFNKVACQTCHIPTYAKVAPTKTYWDWSTACKMKDGKPYEEWNEDKTIEYSSKHGTAHFGKNLKPEYKWWNGITDKTTLETKITTDTVDLNALHGEYDDIHSKIYPMKIQRGTQPYDTKNKTFIQFKTFGPKGSGALWKDFNWQKSARAGMDYIGQPYSGKMDFIPTRSYWPLNHMVSSSEKTLSCTECHSHNGRLQNLTGFYLPGRDVNSLLDWAGKLFVLFSVIGVSVHTALRFLAKKKNYK